MVLVVILFWMSMIISSSFTSKILKTSLEETVFPEKFKIAKVIPVFKKGEEENIENYRPISILPVFSKVLERIGITVCMNIS